MIFCLCTLQMVSDHSEGTFERLRYARSATAPVKLPALTLSLPDHGRWLGKPSTTGWYPNSDSSQTAVHSSRPSYPCTCSARSVSNWDKAPRGLSVLARVTSIFTGTSISPDALSRQCSNHYAFRAGRNLPDKNFATLDRVIVTAALGLKFKASLVTSPLNLPALAGRQPIYLPFRFRIDLCFAKQLLEPITLRPTIQWHPFSRSCRVILPNSLTMLLPSYQILSSSCRFTVRAHIKQ